LAAPPRAAAQSGRTPTAPPARRDCKEIYVGAATVERRRRERSTSAPDGHGPGD